MEEEGSVEKEERRRRRGRRKRRKKRGTRTCGVSASRNWRQPVLTTQLRTPNRARGDLHDSPGGHD